MKYICHFDGDCEPINPGGNMGIGALIKNQDGAEMMCFSQFVPKSWSNSNNIAEYTAFGTIIDWLDDHCSNQDSAVIYGDSMLVVRQMNGEWKMKKGLYLNAAKQIAAKLSLLKARMQIEIAWTPREYNIDADQLSKAQFEKRNSPIATH